MNKLLSIVTLGACLVLVTAYGRKGGNMFQIRPHFPPPPPMIPLIPMRPPLPPPPPPPPPPMFRMFGHGYGGGMHGGFGHQQFFMPPPPMPLPPPPMQFPGFGGGFHHQHGPYCRKNFFGGLPPVG